MMEKCFDSGTIQAFLDGELALEMSQKVTRHIALCDECAVLFATAEEETAFAFAALEREFDTLVPTQRLWAKINDSIIEEKKQSSVWQRFLSQVSIYISSPSIAVAAGVLIVFGLFAGVSSLQNDTDLPYLAEVKEPVVIESPIKISAPENSNQEVSSSKALNIPATEAEQPRPKVQQAVNREEINRNNMRNSAVKAVYASNNRVKNSDVQPAVYTLAYLPGEESYVKTIANLTQTVNNQKDAVLRPSARIAFEHDLAVVTDAIEKMKAEVRKNPRNESAKQVLYSSYQNKIDLLSSVAERNELMASLK